MLCEYCIYCETKLSSKNSGSGTQNILSPLQVFSDKIFSFSFSSNCEDIKCFKFEDICQHSCYAQRNLMDCVKLDTTAILCCSSEGLVIVRTVCSLPAHSKADWVSQSGGRCTATSRGRREKIIPTSSGNPDRSEFTQTWERLNSKAGRDEFSNNHSVLR